jgi:hypothetical protein
MTLLITQYKRYLKTNPSSTYTYNEWISNVLTPNLQKSQHLGDPQASWVNENEEMNEREINFKETCDKISEHLSNLNYDNGDISDVGNEIGFSLGSILNDMNDEEIRSFISGFRHGVSLTNGTHF